MTPQSNHNTVRYTQGGFRGGCKTPLKMFFKNSIFSLSKHHNIEFDPPSPLSKIKSSPDMYTCTYTQILLVQYCCVYMYMYMYMYIICTCTTLMFTHIIFYIIVKLN